LGTGKPVYVISILENFRRALLASVVSPRQDLTAYLIVLRAAVWVHGETLTVEYETETLAQYRVALESDGRRLREVTEPWFFTTEHGSPQPFLAPLEETTWHPARWLAPYRPRRRRDEEDAQAPLFILAKESGGG
jgi:hypothetical protein